MQNQYVGRASDPSKFSSYSANGNGVDNEDLFNKQVYVKNIEYGDDADTDMYQKERGETGLSEIEEEGEYVFQNGAVYNGQWKGNQRHGYGV